ncbi:nitrogen fixation protein NifQ [Donghicola sp. C2-DW-16]|uniref:Nitrogen fixation protein NifQ n=1 Tax=Donghicola mangrovi TaxID=2729614 RepID=A0ABX2PF53_9RHOB|nr:nitrogen fixation protein NifQ [Donghicola mangrovi]NVO28137.1 nitrogen fixation protein NifQ [Donghicola mangrovi]
MRPSTDQPVAPPALAGSALFGADIMYILEHAMAERAAGQGPLTDRLGLSGADLTELRDKWLPNALLPDLHLPAPERPSDQQAIATLILWKSEAGTPEARWLSAIISRRAMETRHLWEDLGLPNRAYLSAMIRRHLPGLAAANHANMRWKKFFYRQICSDAAFSLCLSPTCDDCPERADCFAPD